MRVIREGAGTRVRGVKQRILLAHLALGEGRPVPVRRLMDDLWPEAQPKDPLHSLQEHVSRLRTTTGLDVGLVDGGGYRIRGSVRCDVLEFMTLCKQGNVELAAGAYTQALATLERAQSLWDGAAIEGLEHVDGLRVHILRLEEAWRQCASDRWDAYLYSGKSRLVLDELREAVRDDPLDEYARLQYITALYDSGQRNDALIAYKEARETFIEMLGIGPTKELEELHTTILAEADDALLRGRGQRREPDPPGIERLVARSNEIEVLHEQWRRSQDGVQIVTISGEPGIGKTALVQEFSKQVRAGGGVVLTGRCRRMHTGAYHPFSQILEESVAHAPASRAPRFRHAGVLATLSPRFAGDDHRSGTVDRTSTMEAIAAWCEELGERLGPVIVVEDAQWADEQSLLLLRHLVSSPRRIRALVVVTLRDLGLDRGESGFLLRQGGGISHLPLTRMDRADTARIVRSEAPDVDLGGQLITRIHARSAGNPLFTVELARSLRLTGTQEWQLPTGLQYVIDEHVAALGDSTAAVLRQAAIFSDSFHPAVLEVVTDQGTAEVDRALVISERHGILTRVADGGYAFSHEVVREALYEGIPPLHRAELHSRVAEELTRMGAGRVRDFHMKVAHHLKLGSRPASADVARHLYSAGQEALTTNAYRHAREILGEAHDLLGGTQEEALRCDVLTLLGTAEFRGGSKNYRQTLLAATRSAMRLGDGRRLTAAVLANSRGWWSSSTQIDHERVAGVEAALAVCDEGDQGTHAQLLIMWAQENVQDDTLRRRVLEVSEHALELARSQDDPEVLALVLAGRYAVLYALFENPAECIDLSRRLLDVAQRNALRPMILSGAIGLAQASMRFGDFDTADRYLDQARSLSETIDHPPRTWLVKGWLAMRTAMRGRLEEAEAAVMETHEYGTRTGQSDAQSWFYGQLFTIRMLQGRLPDLASELQDHAVRIEHRIPAWKPALALMLAQSGRVAEANEHVDDVYADGTPLLPRDMLWLNGMCYLALASERLGRADLAPRLYELLVPYSGMVAMNGTIDAGPVDLHLGILADLMGRTATARAHLQSAVDQSRRMNAQVWRDTARGRLAAQALPG